VGPNAGNTPNFLHLTNLSFLLKSITPNPTESEDFSTKQYTHTLIPKQHPTVHTELRTSVGTTASQTTRQAQAKHSTPQLSTPIPSPVYSDEPSFPTDPVGPSPPSAPSPSNSHPNHANHHIEPPRLPALVLVTPHPILLRIPIRPRRRMHAPPRPTATPTPAPHPLRPRRRSLVIRTARHGVGLIGRGGFVRACAGDV